MSVKNLNALKLKLISEPDFMVTMEYFFDHFAENDEFMKLGGPLPDRNHRIFEVVPRTGAELLTTYGVKLGNIAIGGLRPIYVAEEQFIHGSLMLERYLIVFFYFEDLDVGLLCADTADGMTRLARLTLRPIKKKFF